jgi:hypothetical protein
VSRVDCILFESKQCFEFLDLAEHVVGSFCCGEVTVTFFAEEENEEGSPTLWISG